MIKAGIMVQKVSEYNDKDYEENFVTFNIDDFPTVDEVNEALEKVKSEISSVPIMLQNSELYINIVDDIFSDEHVNKILNDESTLSCAAIYWLAVVVASRTVNNVDLSDYALKKDILHVVKSDKTQCDSIAAVPLLAYVDNTYMARTETNILPKQVKVLESSLIMY